MLRGYRLLWTWLALQNRRGDVWGAARLWLAHADRAETDNGFEFCLNSSNGICLRFPVRIFGLSLILSGMSAVFERFLLRKITCLVTTMGLILGTVAGLSAFREGRQPEWAVGHRLQYLSASIPKYRHGVPVCRGQHPQRSRTRLRRCANAFDSYPYPCCANHAHIRHRKPRLVKEYNPKLLGGGMERTPICRGWSAPPPAPREDRNGYQFGF